MMRDVLCEQRSRQSVTPDPEVELLKARKERKRAKKASGESKLLRQLHGEHTRVRTPVAA